MHRIEWKPKAVKQLAKLPAADNANVRRAVGGLAAFPDVPHVKHLVNHRRDAYRLRVGRYRVLFDFDGSVKVITIEEVKKRDDRTY